MELQEAKSWGPPLVHLPESPVVLRYPCSLGWQAVGRVCVYVCMCVCVKASSRGMLTLSQPQDLGVVRVLNRGGVPALERRGAGLHCTKYFGRATGGGAQPVCTEILHLKKENLI